MSARDQDTGAYHVWYVSYPGGAARKVTDGVNSQNGVSVSADSSQLLTVEERTLAGIWRMRSTQAKDAEPVSPESANCVAPQWTADGRIVFEQQLNGQRNIWTMAADGTARKQLTVTGSNYDPSISSDGRMLSFMSDRNGSPAIWTMDIDGGNPVMVFKTDAEPFPQLSPDGKWIAFTATGPRHWPTLRRVASRRGPATELNDRLWLQPSISPDGKWIAGFYAEHPSGTQNFPDSIAVIGTDGGQPGNVMPIPAS
jgi:Tol biopolymer transport system component